MVFKQVEAICEICESKYMAKSPKQKTCSGECNEKLRINQIHAKWVNKKPQWKPDYKTKSRVNASLYKSNRAVLKNP